MLPVQLLEIFPGKLAGRAVEFKVFDRVKNQFFPMQQFGGMRPFALRDLLIARAAAEKRIKNKRTGGKNYEIRDEFDHKWLRRSVQVFVHLQVRLRDGNE